MYHAAVLTVSDRVSRGERPDEGGPRDVTPEATLAVCDRLTPGIPEAMRYASMQITSRAMLSRAQAGIRKGTLILNLPGSPKAAKENLEAVLPAISHGLEMLSGRPADCAKLTD